MNEELKTYKMTITIRCQDEMDSLRNWVSEEIRYGLEYAQEDGEDILNFDIEEVE